LGGDNASNKSSKSAATSSSSSSNSGGANAAAILLCQQKSKSFDTAVIDDYSFSNVEGDYGPMTPSRRALQSNSSPSRRTITSNGGSDEFSIPDEYDDSMNATLYSKVAKGVSKAAYLMSPGNSGSQNSRSSPMKSPIPSSAPRRVTASDIASPTEVDEWSIRSYQTTSPSHHPLHREWSDNASVGGTSSQKSGSQSKSPRRKISIPRFT